MSNKTKFAVLLTSVIGASGVLFTTGYEGWRSKPYYDTGGTETRPKNIAMIFAIKVV